MAWCVAKLSRCNRSHEHMYYLIIIVIQHHLWQFSPLWHQKQIVTITMCHFHSHDHQDDSAPFVSISNQTPLQVTLSRKRAPPWRRSQDWDGDKAFAAEDQLHVREIHGGSHCWGYPVQLCAAFLKECLTFVLDERLFGFLWSSSNWAVFY